MSNTEKNISKDSYKKVEPRRIASFKQIDFLIGFLHDHEELRNSRLRSKEGLYVTRKLWEVCTEKLNKLGPSRNSKEWTKYWSDLKSRVKQKAAEINKRNSITGEGCNSGLALTYAETKIINLLEHDRQMNLSQEIPLDYSSGSLLESINYTVIKEERDDETAEDMNIEEFISNAPVLDPIAPIATVQLPVNQPHEAEVGSAPAVDAIPQQCSTPQPPTANGAELINLDMQLSPRGHGAPLRGAQTVPPESTFIPKRRRRKVHVEPPHPIRCEVAQCMNCRELKEFANLMLKLEESHARTTKIQTEASLKMTEVLKLQAEGIMHTGIALREMAYNLCKLFKGPNNTTSI